MADQTITALPAEGPPEAPPEQDEPPERVKRGAVDQALFIGVRVIAGILLLIALIWLVLFLTKGRFLKSTFETYAGRAAGREIDVGGDFQLYFNPINIKFLAEGIRIANPAWAKERDVFSARLIDIDIATFPLILGNRRVNWLTLDGGRVNLAWDEAHRRNTWTFGDPNRPAQPLDLPKIRRAGVTGSRVTYSDPAMRLAADIGIDTIRARDTRFDGAIGFSGGGTLKERPFTLSGRLLSPNETVSGGRNQLIARAEAAGNVLDVSGTLPGATVIDGADLRVAARGPNLARLFDFIGVAVPDTRRYQIASRLTKQGDVWRFTRLNGRFGDSDLAGRMTITMPNDRLRIDADLTSRMVDIIDVGPFIGYDPTRIEKAGDRGIIREVGGAPRILPDAPLRVEAIKAFDAHVDYAVRRVRAESFPVSNIAMTLDLDRSLLRLSPLTFDVAGGHLASDIAINARGTPVVTDYDIRLSPTPMGTLLARFGAEQAGTSGVLKARVQMKGEGDTVHESLASSDGRIAIILPRGTFWTRNIQLSELDIGTFITKMFEGKLKTPVEINCGLIAFTVRDGIATADPILIDTRKNVMLGRGRFSFKDESLALAFRADSKKFSLFSAQSPVGIGGYFARPGIDVISPELLARGGVGAALGLAASPLAAVLAFVDVGDAKAADCGPILAGASAAAQRTAKGKPRDDVKG